jgi:6,7-dimethyl-8-ribityllumazine synthase
MKIIQNTFNQMIKKDVKALAKQELKQGGHDDKRIEEIIEIASNSSNPGYIFHYWGAKKTARLFN